MPYETRAPKDEVDLATAALRRAVGRLIRLLGHDDPRVVTRAALALHELGPYAAGPLAAALPRAGSRRAKVMIIAALRGGGAATRAAATAAAWRAMRREEDPVVRAAAHRAHRWLMREALEAVAAGAAGPAVSTGTGVGPRRGIGGRARGEE
jgi:hypothetical protein